MDPIIGGALISGGAGLLSNIFGGSKSSGSQTTVPTQGQWDPDSKRIWDDMMVQIFGDADTPTLRGRMGADDQYQRNAYEDFFKKSGASTQGYLNQIGGAAQKYLGNPVSGSIGGQGISFIPKASARSYGNVADYAGQAMGAQDVYDTRVLNYNKEYTPYRADMNYLNQIMPLAREGQAHTWGQTTSADLNPSLLSDIGTAGEVVSPWIELLKKKTETFDPAAYAGLYGPQPGLME